MGKEGGRGRRGRLTAEGKFDLFGEITRDIRDADNMVARVLKVRPFKRKDIPKSLPPKGLV
jgi:hypothetical protein